MPDPAIFLHYSQRDLDNAYDQRVWAPNMPQLVARYASESQRLRPSATIETLRYGSGPHEELDLFRADGGLRPVQIYLHGGAWRSGDKETYGFIGHALSRHGINCAVVDFSPVQTAGLAHMVEQVARAVSFLHDSADHLGIDQTRLTIMGHSSGAHLGACLLSGAADRKPREVLKAGFLLGGIYDLEPVLLSSRNAYLNLSQEEAARLSPASSAENISVPIIVGYGDGESPEFKRQAEAFAARLAEAGRLGRLVEISRRNHFETLLDFVDGGETLRLALETAACAPAATARFGVGRFGAGPPLRSGR